MARPRVLLVYHNSLPALRETNRLSLEAWRHAPADVVFHNTHLGPPPPKVVAAGFDAVIFHALFMSEKWSAPAWRRALAAAAPLRRLESPKACFVQDEFLNSAWAARFIRDFSISHLFSLATPEVARELYGPALDGLAVHRVLPGYVDDVSRPSAPPPPLASRPIDVGYRTWDAPAWTGRFGRLKSRIGEAAREAGSNLGLVTDISLSPGDAILGAAWPRFLRDCKAVVGVESGASLHDPEGVFRAATDAYLAAHPTAEVETVAAACLTQARDDLAYRAIAPRNFEAAAAGAAQILVSGDYSGVLKPEQHYVPVRPDLSDLPFALARLRDPASLQPMVDRARHDLILSGRYGWRAHIAETIKILTPSESRRRRGAILDLNLHRADQKIGWAQRLAFDYPDRAPATHGERLLRRIGSARTRLAARIDHIQRRTRSTAISPDGDLVAVVSAWRARIPSPDSLVYWQQAVLDLRLTGGIVALFGGASHDDLDVDLVSEWLQAFPTARLLLAAARPGDDRSDTDRARIEGWLASGRACLLGCLSPWELGLAARGADIVVEPLKFPPPAPSPGLAEALRIGAPVLVSHGQDSTRKAFFAELSRLERLGPRYSADLD